jgi:hypothetical protein
MDRLQGIALLLLCACGGRPAPTHAKKLRVQVVSRGTLGYAVELAGDRVVTVELGERFELVVRDTPSAKPRALDLGPAETDWVALAAAGDRAWVGGDTGEVIAVDVARLAEEARWPIGAPVTALAASGDHVAIGDATGVLCLRRADDGALLQCVVAHDGAIAELDVIGDSLITGDATGSTAAWSVPSLAVAEAGAASPFVVDGKRVLDARGGLVVEMGGAVQDFAVSPTGQLAVAAWITSLDQASVVLVE